MSENVITFKKEYTEEFKKLNLEWIQKYFVVEAKDIEQLQKPEAIIKDGGEIFFVMEDNEPVGTCAMIRKDLTTYELAKMAVSPKCRGKGYGDILITAAEAWAFKNGIKKIFLRSNTILVPAIELYKKNGYQIVHLGPDSEYTRSNIEMEKYLLD